MKKIYKTYLIKEGACQDQVKLFNKHYPKGIHVCADCFEDAQNLGLDVYWLKRFLYSGYRNKHDLQWQFINNHTFITCSFYSFYIHRLVSAEGLRVLARELLNTPRP